MNTVIVLPVPGNQNNAVFRVNEVGLESHNF